LVVEELVTAMDLFPTVAGLVGAELPRDRILDGKDVWPLMAGRPGAVTPHDAFFYYWPDQLHAVRSGRWKLHVPHSYRTVEGGKLATRTFQGTYAQGKIGLSLFDVENDVGETTNLAHDNPEVVTRLMALIEQARDDLGDALTGREGRNVRPPGRV
jgi:arylsulfatase A-like enzyme